MVWRTDRSSINPGSFVYGAGAALMRPGSDSNMAVLARTIAQHRALLGALARITRCWILAHAWRGVRRECSRDRAPKSGARGRTGSCDEWRRGHAA
jgi:hypothetical protein